MQGCYIAGADPELMLLSPAGQLVSAIPFIRGTKEKPQKVKGGAIQRDNVMAEFNVEPAGSSEEFEHNTRTVLQELARAVRPHQLTVLAYAQFPEAELEHEDARVFGCDPDFCAWPNSEGFLEMNTIPAEKAWEPFRSAGGHFHLGQTKETAEVLQDDFGKIEVVKMLDIFQGIPSVLLDPDPSAKMRRGLYGQAGAHRPKPYGVEYRALGNFWLRSPDLVHLMYELAHRAVELVLNGESEKITAKVGQKAVQSIINRSQPRKARQVVQNVLQPYLSAELWEKLHSRIPSRAKPGPSLYEAWDI